MGAPTIALISVGCTLGMVTPPLSGFLFKTVDPMWIWYMCLACVLLQIIAYFTLLFSFRKDTFKNQEKEDEKISETELQ